MPLSDLFKRSPKMGIPKSPQPEPVRDDPFGSPELQKKRYAAALEFLGVLQEYAPQVQGHAGTILSVAAWLAGTSLYRSMNYKQDPPAGTIMLSEEVNEAWPELMNLFLYYCKRSGLEIQPDQMVLEPPPADKPKIEIQPAQEKFQDIYNEIMQKHGLDYRDGARAGMIACSLIFQYHCTKVRDIESRVAAGIVSMGVVAGAKTVPPPPGSGSSSRNSEVKMKNDNRLVLGERQAVLQEAREPGGIHIDPNPGVLQALQSGGIDPYLIYEQAMRKQIEDKIPRIDFVQSDVNALLDEWKSKPGDQAPIHVRLILWLKKNAAAHGYSQSGNSWILER